jgi:hypothetical protein
VAGASVDIPDLKALRKSLKGLENEREWAKALSGMNRDLARDLAGWSNSAASSVSAQAGHFAGAFKGLATATAGRVVVGGARTPKGKYRAAPAFWGTKAQGNWIGTGWEVGVPGQGPYALNETIARRSVEIENRMRAVVDKVTDGALS